MPDRSRILAVGAVLAAVAVAAGAFGAHALRDVVTSERLATFETAARYHLVHALAIVLVAALSADRRGLEPVAWLFGVGIVLFAGSLYALVLLDLPVLGAVTPLGGVAFIGGWLLLAWRAVRPAQA